jgi:hypothetical protein
MICREIEQLAGLDSPDRTPQSICACVAQIFQVRETEVALLELSGRMLNFHILPSMPEEKVTGKVTNVPLLAFPVSATWVDRRRLDIPEI